MAAPVQVLDEADCFQYILKKSPVPIPIVADCTEIKPSVLATTFPRDASNGLFATKRIGRSRGICLESDTKLSNMPNDPCVDLTALLAAKTNIDTHRALVDLYDNYYVESKLTLVNCAMTLTPTGVIYTALRRIEAGEEIYRCYGAVSWPPMLMGMVTNYNVHAFAHWLHHIVTKLPKTNPSYQMLYDMQQALQPSHTDMAAADARMAESNAPVKHYRDEIVREMNMQATIRRMGLKVPHFG